MKFKVFPFLFALLKLKQTPKQKKFVQHLWFDPPVLQLFDTKCQPFHKPPDFRRNQSTERFALLMEVLGLLLLWAQTQISWSPVRTNWFEKALLCGFHFVATDKGTKWYWSRPWFRLDETFVYFSPSPWMSPPMTSQDITPLWGKAPLMHWCVTPLHVTPLYRNVTPHWCVTPSDFSPPLPAVHGDDGSQVLWGHISSCIFRSHEEMPRSSRYTATSQITSTPITSQITSQDVSCPSREMSPPPLMCQCLLLLVTSL